VPVLGVAEGQIVSTPEPEVFAKDWSAAWNRRDVEAVLTHFHDDVVFTSPVAAELMPGSAGVVRGKAACVSIGPRRWPRSPGCGSRSSTFTRANPY
jgi:hypothetical protein